MSWHYFATSHGKGVVDGLGGTVKRLVYSSILGGQQCKSAADFVAIAQSKTKVMEIIEIQQSRIDDSKARLENIFNATKSIPQTKKIHSIRVLTNNSIECKYYSNSTQVKNHHFSI